MNEPDTTSAPTESATSTEDSELLRLYVADGRQDAFSELVRRHVSLVYHAALRQLGNVDQAEDVTQVVFIDLARKAAALRHRSVLSGWLHTSTRFAVSNLRRRQTRQQQRDHDSFLMQHVTSDESVDWARLRPVIDEALYALGEREREAVLLRFFEGQSFAQIGEKLVVTEDSARVRVNRALEKLSGILQRRGMTSTAATLAITLSTETATATSAGLANHIATSALAASAMGNAGVLSGLFAKLAIGVTATTAIVAVSVAVRQASSVHELREQVTTSDLQRAELRSKLAITQAQLAVAKTQAEAESADTAKLLSAIASMRSTTVKAPASAAAAGDALTTESVQTRFQHAQQLARDGHWEEALPELLWCFDEGMVRISSLTGVRRSFLTSALGDLAQKYPPARAAIEERLVAAEQKFELNPNDRDAPADFAALNHALNDDARTLAVYDHLAVDDPRRRNLGRVYLYDVFVTMQRYSDAVQTRPYESSVQTFTAMERNLSEHAFPADASASLRRNLVTTSAKSVEALAGSGDLQHAREFAARVLAFDGSTETRAILQAHVARAGHPELIIVPVTK
ncbi:MAG: sigma-70 family RNA polymerase sigma factor [Opitutus sp.]